MEYQRLFFLRRRHEVFSDTITIKIFRSCKITFVRDRCFNTAWGRWIKYTIIVASNVISIKPYVNQLTGNWLNSFVFIEEDSSSVDIFYSLGYNIVTWRRLPSENDKVPNFANYINVVSSEPNFKCFDVDFLA